MMGRPPKKFYRQQAQRLFRAIWAEAVLDALDSDGAVQKYEMEDLFASDAAVKADALDFLFTERSDVAVMAQGIADVDQFREKLRERLSATVISVSLPNSPTVIFENDIETAA